jgi:hypothetical protein
MENCSELCHALNKIVSKEKNANSSKNTASSPRPPALQTSDLLGLDVEGMVLLPLLL